MVPRAIKHQLAVIQKQTNRTLPRRALEGQKDAGEIVVAYRTISYLLDAFQVSLLFGTPFLFSDKFS